MSGLLNNLILVILHTNHYWNPHSQGAAARQVSTIADNTGTAVLLSWYFMSTETLLRMGAQDGHLDFHPDPELCSCIVI